MLKRLFKKKKSAAEAPLPDPDKISILFVCMGNICRSPSAQGVFAKLIEEQGIKEALYLDSAGTVPYHVGKEPDARAQAEAGERGYDLSRYRARLVTAADCEAFDYVVVMDNTNMLDVRAVSPKRYWEKIHLLMDYSPGPPGREVPDPYSGEQADFSTALDLIEKAAQGLINQIRRDHRL